MKATTKKLNKKYFAVYDQCGDVDDLDLYATFKSYKAALKCVKEHALDGAGDTFIIAKVTHLLRVKTPDLR
jgi:hypothetical protein